MSVSDQIQRDGALAYISNATRIFHPFVVLSIGLICSVLLSFAPRTASATIISVPSIQTGSKIQRIAGPSTSLQSSSSENTSMSRSVFLPIISSASVNPSSAEFPAQQRLDTSKLVAYQVWLNYYAQNNVNGQTSPSAFANAQAHLSELAQMGVTLIQLSPFQPFPGQGTIGSPYGSLDYEDVNPGYAGFSAVNPGMKDTRIQALKNYVAAAHQLGMQVIMDCVYHSTADNNVLLTTHPDYYLHDANGNIVTNQWGLYVLDYTNPNTRAYMMNMTKYWESTVDIDGCRADAAVDVPLAFWAMVNNELKKIKPNWLMIAETSGQIPEYAGTYTGPGYSPSETYNQVYAFDALYGVDHMVSERAVINNTAQASMIQSTWQYPEQPYTVAPPETIFYRAVDNHDQKPRAVCLAGGNSGMVAAMAINFTLDGIPFIFNGQEIGDPAPTSIQIQQFISWTQPAAPGDRALFTQMIGLRRAYPALNQGTTTWYTSDAPNQIVSYLRQAGAERVLVVVNLSNSSLTTTITGTADHPLTGKLTGLMTNQAVPTQPSNNRVQLSLGPYSYLIASLQ